MLALVFLLIASFTRRERRVVWSAIAWVLIGVQICGSFVLMDFAGLAHERDTALDTYMIVSMIVAVVLAGGWSFILFRRPIPKYDNAA